MPVSVSTDRLISATDARRRFGRLLSDIVADQENYFVILDNGKVSAFLVGQKFMEKKNHPHTEDPRAVWRRHEKSIEEALAQISGQKKLPRLLRAA